jgi:hypothetical protein
MNRVDQLLRLAIDDNIGWCGAVCAAHGADEDISSVAWTNLRPSPPFYPNIITREPGTQTGILKVIERLTALAIPKGWGIKDSFCDLALADIGFELVLKGSWFGGVPTRAPKQPDNRWKKVASSKDLLRWEMAWGGEREARIFTDVLLADRRVEFWSLRPDEMIEAGFICFRSGRSIGLSNWFSLNGQSVFERGALEIVASRFSGSPIVFWASDGDFVYETNAVSQLGPLQVWISKP